VMTMKLEVILATARPDKPTISDTLKEGKVLLRNAILNDVR
jgi:hypothetical protein